MRLALHTFRKDVRLLRWPVAVTLVLQFLLAREDGWRADRIPGSTEGWLNLLLPLAWACLMGLTIEEEPLAGDRQFWITRPYRWPELLGAKALFAIAFIHAPSFLADAWILSARGFNPWEHLPQLLWKQALLAGAVTLPAAALATLAANFTQFMMALLAVAAGLAVVSGGLWNRPMMIGLMGRWPIFDAVREHLTILTGAAAAIAIILMQYAARRTAASRVVGVAGAVCAGLLLGYLPPASAIGLSLALSPAHPELGLRIDSQPVSQPPGMSLGRVTVSIPVVISGIPTGMQEHFLRLENEVLGDGGATYSALPAFQPAARAMMLSYLTENPVSGRHQLGLQFTRAAYERLKQRKATIKGAEAVTFYRMGETSNVPIGGSAQVAGVGRCSSFTVDTGLNEAMLKVVCESPDPIPQNTMVRLRNPEGPQEWNMQLNSSYRPVSAPAETWLSPIYRSVVYFQLASETQGAGQQWLVPISAVGRAKLSVTPELVTGYAVLRYELKDVRLSEFAR